MTENAKAYTGTPLELVVPRQHTRFSNFVRLLFFNPRVKPKSVREATYSEVFAALKTASIKQPFKNPGKIGILAFLATIMISDSGLHALRGSDTSKGSFQDTSKYDSSAVTM